MMEATSNNDIPKEVLLEEDAQYTPVDLSVADSYSSSTGLTRVEEMDAGRLYTKEIVDYEKSCRPLRTSLESVDDLRVGNHLHWRRAGSWRDGIITAISEGIQRKITMIRYGYVFPQMVLQEETWELNFGSDFITRFEYGDYCHPPSIVVARAKACIGQKGYNALRNNNDDFCRWCMSGKHTYLCVNETVLTPDADTQHEEGTFRSIITSIDEMNQGDHVAWTRISFDEPEKDGDDGWRHGIVADNDEEIVCVLGFDDKSLSISELIFDRNKMLDYKMRHIIYEKCHMLDDVIDRARFHKGTAYIPEDNKYFAQWCKTGLPQDAEAVDTTLIKPKSEVRDEEELEKQANMKAEAAKSATRATVTSATRGTAEGIAGTAARQAPRVLARGAAEGAAAVAAVGVEAVVLAVEVGLTYRAFNRREVSKDEVHRRHIQSTTRSVGAAGAGVGGGVAGAAIGTLVFPGVGTIVGGIIGGIAGGISGQIGGHFAGKGIAYAARRPYDNMFVENLVIPD